MPKNVTCKYYSAFDSKVRDQISYKGVQNFLFNMLISRPIAMASHNIRSGVGYTVAGSSHGNTVVAGELQMGDTTIVAKLYSSKVL